MIYPIAAAAAAAVLVPAVLSVVCQESVVVPSRLRRGDSSKGACWLAAASKGGERRGVVGVGGCEGKGRELGGFVWSLAVVGCLVGVVGRRGEGGGGGGRCVQEVELRLRESRWKRKDGQRARARAWASRRMKTALRPSRPLKSQQCPSREAREPLPLRPHGASIASSLNATTRKKGSPRGSSSTSTYRQGTHHLLAEFISELWSSSLLLPRHRRLCFACVWTGGRAGGPRGVAHGR